MGKKAVMFTEDDYGSVQLRDRGFGDSDGKKAVMFTEDEDIVRQLQTGQVSELLEPSLLELDQESSEWEEFLLGVKVELLCTMCERTEKPLMTDVVFRGLQAGTGGSDPTALPVNNL